MKNKVQLITYADRLGDGTLSSMTDILRTRFDGVYDGVHILPFFTPFDGADAGFDPIDHTKVDPRLGAWDDVAELSTTHDIMVDAIVNHMSWESAQFRARACRSPTTTSAARPVWYGSASPRSRWTSTLIPPRAGNT